MSQYNEMVKKKKKKLFLINRDCLCYLSLHRQHSFIFNSTISFQYMKFDVVFSQGSANTWLACMANCGLSQFY